MSLYRFYLPDIRCANCIEPIEQALIKAGISQDCFSIDLDTKRLTIESDYSGDVIQSTVQSTGVSCVEQIQPASRLYRFFHAHWVRGFSGILTGALLLIMSLTGVAFSWPWMVAIGLGSVLLTLALGAESYWDAAKKLIKAKTLTMDTLFAMSTLTIMTVSMLSFWVPWLPMMFEAGLLIFGFRHLGLAIEASIKKTLQLNVCFQDRLPKYVSKYTESGTMTIQLEAVKPLDVLCIQAGELIPVDGMSETPVKVMDTIVTGRTIPRVIPKNNPLLAGMRLADDALPIRFQVSALAKDSYLSQLDARIEAAEREKAPLEAAAGRILQYFIPMVIGLSLLSGGLVAPFFPLAMAIKCAVSVLVSACPCTLGLITPLAVKIGMKKAMDNGVQFKSAKTLQEAAEIDRVVFDLNGTLTSGTPTVCAFEKFDNDLEASTLLTYARALETNNTHPVARAIMDFTQDKQVSSLSTPNNVNQSHHSGVSALIEGQYYYLGNRVMMQDYGIDLPDKPAQPQAGESFIYLACGKKIQGMFRIRDPLRLKAQFIVQRLKASGKRVYLCTGADRASAQSYAQVLGIASEDVKAACRETDKRDYIQSLGKKVAMVGDAGNDAEAISAAGFGLAIQSAYGDEVAQARAGAVIRDAALLPVVNAFAISAQTVRHIKQNLTISLAYNLAAVLIMGGLLLTIGMTLNPAVGVVLMMVQSSLMLLNAYRFKQQSFDSVQGSADPTGADDSPGSSYAQICQVPGLAPGLKPNESWSPAGETTQHSPVEAHRDSPGVTNSPRFGHP